MIGNNRHSDRTFVSEHICGRLAPSAGHADARLLALVLPFSPSRPLSLAPSRYRSSSLSSAAPSLFFNPRFLLARSSASALYRTLSVSSRARPSSRLHSRSYRRVLRSSRASLFLFRSLSFRPRYITTLPRLVRSSSNSPPARRFATARIFAFFSLAPSIPPGAPSPSLFVPKPLSIFLSSSLPHLASLFPRPLFRSPRLFSFSDQRFFARRLCIVWCLVCGTYIIQARGRVRVRPGRPSRARLSRRGETRVFESLRYAFMGKKKWADVSSALVTAACKYAAAEGARTRHACTGSVEELLPFLSASFLYRPGFSNIFARYPLRRGI